MPSRRVGGHLASKSDPRIQESLRRSVARLHHNLGYPQEAELLRKSSFAGATRDALLRVKGRRCAICLRRQAQIVGLRPARNVIL